MLELADIVDISIEVSFPKDFKLDLGKEILKTPLEKIKTDSFSSADITFRRIMNDLFGDIPFVSMRGKFGLFNLSRKSLNVILFPKEGRGRFRTVGKEGKLISSKELESVSNDSNYLFGSILGTFNLLDRKMLVEISTHFSKEGIFLTNFNDKIKEESLRNHSITEVWGIYFKRRVENKPNSTEMTYEFEHKEKDEVKVIERKERVFSPFNIPSIIEETLKATNGVLKEWCTNEN